MGDGRKAWAPCGHMGEVVIGTYVQCSWCDAVAVPKHVDPERTEPLRAARCPYCASMDIEEFATDIDAAMWYLGQHNIPSGPVMPPQGGEWHCWPCGKVFSL